MNRLVIFNSKLFKTAFMQKEYEAFFVSRVDSSGG